MRDRVPLLCRSLPVFVPALTGSRTATNPKDMAQRFLHVRKTVCLDEAPESLIVVRGRIPIAQFSIVVKPNLVFSR